MLNALPSNVSPWCVRNKRKRENLFVDRNRSPSRFSSPAFCFFLSYPPSSSYLNVILLLNSGLLVPWLAHNRTVGGFIEKREKKNVTCSPRSES